MDITNRNIGSVDENDRHADSDCAIDESVETVSEEEDHPVVPDQFRVSDSESASWMVRRVTEARFYQARVKLWAQREIRRAQRDEDWLMHRYGPELEIWAKEEVGRLRGKRRSISLPSGSVGFRKVAANLVIDEEAAVIEWALVHCPLAVVVAKKLSKSVLIEHLKKTGEIPDSGAHIQTESDRFYVR